MGKLEHVVVGLDLSITSSGYAVMGLDKDGNPEIITYGESKTKSSDLMGKRLSDITNEVASHLTNDVVAVVSERGFSRFPAVTQTLFKLHGSVEMTVFREMGIGVHEVATTSIKKIVAGNGRASKEDVAEAVFKRLGIAEDEQKDAFYTPRGKLKDDITDALAVSLAYYIDEGLIK